MTNRHDQQPPAAAAPPAPSLVRRAWKNLARLSKFLYYKVIRSRGTPYSIAMGVAIGIFVGAIVPLGLQIVVSIALAFLLRAQKFVAFLFTWYTNIWTVPFIYPLFCLLGAKIINDDSINVRKAAADFISITQAESLQESWAILYSLGGDILLTFFVGSGVFGAVAGVLGFVATYWGVASFQEHRRRSMEERQARQC